MKVFILNQKNLDVLDLPKDIEGSFWLLDMDQKNEKILGIEAKDNHWVSYSNSIYKLVKNDQEVSSLVLEDNKLYTLKGNKITKLFYTSRNYDISFRLYQCKNCTSIKIGRDASSHICFQSEMIKATYLTLQYESDKIYLLKNKEEWVYVNGIRSYGDRVLLHNGDELFWYGLRLVVFNQYLFVNNPNNSVKINYSYLFPISFKTYDLPYSEIKEEDLYQEEDYYVKAPRLRHFIETYDITISAPPKKENMEEMPLIFLLGPMLTMGATSCVSLINVLLRISNGSSSWKDSWPSVFASVAMLTTTLVWPNLTKKWQKKQKIKKEKERVLKYSEYIDEKWKLLEKEMVRQQQILKENLLSLQECFNIIVQKQRILWERKLNQKDFLTVRLGIGDVSLDANIHFNEEDFVLEEDEMKTSAQRLVDRSKLLKDMPVGYSFFNKNVIAVVGQDNLLYPAINNIVLQLVAYHSYDEVKTVVFTNKANEEHWDYFRFLPHSFSNEQDIRFFAISDEERSTVSDYLAQIFVSRVTSQNASVEKEESEEDNNVKSTYSPYYLIFTDDFPSIRNLGIIDLLLKNSSNFGFSLIVRESRLRRLPSECENFINITGDVSAILQVDPENSLEQRFISEIDDSFSMMQVARVLSNTPIALDSSTRYLPDSINFLEMYNVGKIEQLNILNRWRLNDSTQSLKSLVGINDLNEPIYLDLHEKKHGPHGLIAGTTGSGKSEFIITYILSLALNYSPNDVAFILIDYKGGGLAGAFENEKNQIHLPHLAGTITNLDKNELNRTLVSIDSELKRRQEKFNLARENLGESTMDIYKYQRFFHEHKLDEAIPHLFIICDEFAELKAQQPEFMDNLISAARIGRSLGVHLILATQKPSGVVNDQIWSNTKFRVCLKVANASDSNEMLKKPDAALIKNPGRFYLQVGMDEIYVLGQSGYAGANYLPKDSALKEYDRSISFVNHTLGVYKNVSNDKKEKVIESNGDEITNILKYVTSLAERMDIHAKRLWFDNIPGVIYLKDLISKYSFQKGSSVEAILGEYDDPTNQKQGILKLSLDEDGNTLVFGVSGVGREMFLKSILFSCSILYSTLDINFYVMDFGSESMKIFEALPHVSDVVFSAEDEKIEKLFSMIQSEIEKRKKMFADYNGEYSTYCKLTKQKLPMICIMLNNYDSFKENYGNYEDLLIKITRDGKRYGIIFIISSTSTSGMFGRLLRNFNHTFVMDMNDKNDYVNILGKIGNVYPASFDGRGLFKEEIAYEFQTASICPSEEVISYVKNTAQQLSTQNTYLPLKIPVLPEVVTLGSMIKHLDSLKNFPIGIEKQSLNVSTYDFTSQKATLISSNDMDTLVSFVSSIVSLMSHIKNVSHIVVDSELFLDKNTIHVNGYCSSDVVSFLPKLQDYVEKNSANKSFQILITILGLDKMVSLLDSKAFTDFVKICSTIDNVHFLFVETAFKLKKYNFENWYTSSVANMNGIWLGSGVMEQSVLKLSDMDRKYKEKISSLYAWNVKFGVGTLVKTIRLEENDEE